METSRPRIIYLTSQNVLTELKLPAAVIERIMSLSSSKPLQGMSFCWISILIISGSHFLSVKIQSQKCGVNHLMYYQHLTSIMQCRDLRLSSCGVTSTFPKTQR